MTREDLALARALRTKDLEEVTALLEAPWWRPLKRHRNQQTLHYLEHLQDVPDPLTDGRECAHDEEFNGNG